jgi:peptide/nickel transport system ATP-binding protein
MPIPVRCPAVNGNGFANPQHPYTQLLLDSMLTVAPGKGIPELRLDTAAREAMRDHPVHIVTN